MLSKLVNSIMDIQIWLKNFEKEYGSLLDVKTDHVTLGKLTHAS